LFIVLATGYSVKDAKDSVHVFHCPKNGLQACKIQRSSTVVFFDHALEFDFGRLDKSKQRSSRAGYARIVPNGSLEIIHCVGGMLKSSRMAALKLSIALGTTETASSLAVAVASSKVVVPDCDSDCEIACSSSALTLSARLTAFVAACMPAGVKAKGLMY
jgi:hypothetical protein